MASESYGALAAAVQVITEHPLGALAIAFLAALLYLDLSRRLMVSGVQKVSWHYPVLGSLPGVIPHVKKGALPDYIRGHAEKAGWKTWASWSPMVSEIVLCSPENIRHVFNTHFQYYELPGIRKAVFDEALGRGIFNSDGARWKEQRAFASHLFSASQLKRRMLHVFTAHAQQVRSILEQVPPGETVDMQKLMYGYTFDAICEIAFGVSVNSVGGVARDVEFQRAFDAVQARSTARFFELFWKLRRRLGWGAEVQMERDIGVVEQYISDILDARDAAGAESADESSDLLTIYEAHCADTGVKVTRDDLRDLVMNFLIAGRDTTASVLTWIFWELAQHPEVAEKVAADIRQHQDTDSMQYTQAVFQEALRLHPSVAADSKQCVRDDTLPDGTKVKKGTLLNFHPCAITRNPNVFPEPNQFNPERWMDEDGLCRKYDEYSYPCFNAGPRVCLGRHMSPMESKVLLAELLTDLRFDVAPGFEPKMKHTVVLMTENGMQMTVRRA